jgi:hypothetical protein
MTDTPTPFLRFVQRYESLTRVGQFGLPETYGHKLIKVLQHKCLLFQMEDRNGWNGEMCKWRTSMTDGNTYAINKHLDDQEALTDA